MFGPFEQEFHLEDGGEMTDRQTQIRMKKNMDVEIATSSVSSLFVKVTDGLA